MNEPLKQFHRSRAPARGCPIGADLRARAPARGCPISVKLREERKSLGKSREEDKEMLM